MEVKLAANVSVGHRAGDLDPSLQVTVEIGLGVVAASRSTTTCSCSVCDSWGLSLAVTWFVFRCLIYRYGSATVERCGPININQEAETKSRVTRHIEVNTLSLPDAKSWIIYIQHKL
jgi:hypothetical protein